MPARATMLVLMTLAVVVAGCGGDEQEAGDDARPTATATATAPRGPVPPVLRTVESAAEDTIDHALAGDRGRPFARPARC